MDILQSLRIHGQNSHKNDNVRTGLNARFDTIQAAVLIPKLGVFPEELLMREDVAKRYRAALEGVVETPKIPAGFKSAWAQYSIMSDKRDLLQTSLKEKGVPSVVYYPIPLHLQEAYSGLGYEEGDFLEAEFVSKNVLSLPMSPYLDEKTQDYIIDMVREGVK